MSNNEGYAGSNRDGHPRERKDPRLVKQALDRGPTELKSRLTEEKGGMGAIANRNVVTIPPSMTIIGAAKTMAKYGFRRLPVTDPGTNSLKGILTSFDLVDFCGGGDRHRLVEERHGGNLLSAVNESVDEIMEEEVLTFGENTSLDEALARMIAHGVGGVPVVDREDRVKAIVTERDFVWMLSDTYLPDAVEEYMTEDVVTADPDLPIKEAAVTMVQNGFRRLPVTKDSLLIGIATSTDIVRYLASDALKKLVTGDSDEAFGLPINEIMTGEVSTVERETSIGDAVSLMTERGIGSLPVLSDGGLQGIITERDFLRALTGE